MTRVHVSRGRRSFAAIVIVAFRQACSETRRADDGERFKTARKGRRNVFISAVLIEIQIRSIFGVQRVTFFLYS